MSVISVNEFFGITAAGFWREVLAGQPGAEIAAALEGQTQTPVDPSHWPRIISGIAERAKGLFDVEIATLIISGWRNYRELIEYTIADRHNPRDTQFVPLGKHTVQVEYSPFFEVLFSSRPLGKIVFDVWFSFDLEGFVLTIQNAKLLKARTGPCTAKGKITYQGYTLIEKPPTRITLPGMIDLGSGVALSRGDEAAL